MDSNGASHGNGRYAGFSPASPENDVRRRRRGTRPPPVALRWHRHRDPAAVRDEIARGVVFLLGQQTAEPDAHAFERAAAPALSLSLAVVFCRRARLWNRDRGRRKLRSRGRVVRAPDVVRVDLRARRLYRRDVLIADFRRLRRGGFGQRLRLRGRGRRERLARERVRRRGTFPPARFLLFRGRSRAGFRFPFRHSLRRRLLTEVESLPDRGGGDRPRRRVPTPAEHLRVNQVLVHVHDVHLDVARFQPRRVHDLIPVFLDRFQGPHRGGLGDDDVRRLRRVRRHRARASSEQPRGPLRGFGRLRRAEVVQTHPASEEVARVPRRRGVLLAFAFERRERGFRLRLFPDDEQALVRSASVAYGRVHPLSLHDAHSGPLARVLELRARRRRRDQVRARVPHEIRAVRAAVRDDFRLQVRALVLRVPRDAHVQAEERGGSVRSRRRRVVRREQRAAGRAVAEPGHRHDRFAQRPRELVLSRRRRLRDAVIERPLRGELVVHDRVDDLRQGRDLALRWSGESGFAVRGRGGGREREERDLGGSCRHRCHDFAPRRLQAAAHLFARVEPGHDEYRLRIVHGVRRRAPSSAVGPASSPSALACGRGFEICRPKTR
eukprot:31198-Pelagococcus_subviridis.AAC.39